MTLPGGFSLPVSLVCDTLTWTEMEEMAVDETTARKQLTDSFHQYLTNQMIAGTVSAGDEVMETKQACYLLTGQYVCSEMIGRERLENGVTHEQSD